MANAQDVTVYNKPGEIACTRKPGAADINPDGFAIIIGNKDYERTGVPDVAYAHYDAAAICDLVVNQLGYPPEQVYVLFDAEKLTFEEWFASSDRSASTLSRLTSGVGSDLELFVYYSGHGMPQDDDAFLLASNASPTRLDIGGFEVDRLTEGLSSLGAKRVLLMLEACFSGRTVGEGGPVPLTSYAVAGAAIEATSPDVTILTAAGSNEVANWDEARGLGLYTGQFLEAFQGRADERGDNNGEVTLAEIVRDLARNVPTRSIRLVAGDTGRLQTPVATGPLDDWSFPIRAMPEPAAPVAEIVEPSAPEVAVVQPERQEPEEAPGVSVIDQSRTASLDTQPTSVDHGKPVATQEKGSRSSSSDWLPEYGEDENKDWSPDYGDTVASWVSPEKQRQADREAEDRLGLTRSQWRDIQAALNGRGYSLGAADGLPGPRTRRGIRDWQADENLDSTGFLVEQQVASLIGSRPDVPAPVKPAVGVYREKTRYEAGDRFKDCDVCPEMVVVPPGSFMMGSPLDEEGRRDNEGPQHSVTIGGPFAIGSKEVSRGEFRAFVDDTGYEVEGGCFTEDNSEWEFRPEHNWRNPGYHQDDSHPVVCVGWEDAAEYVEWLKVRVSTSYILPSEAEWEYAARAGTQARRYWGDDLANNLTCDFANANDIFSEKANGFPIPSFPCVDGYARTAPVGSYIANPFGLYDMLGNAWEFTYDCWHDSYQGASNDRDPRLDGECTLRVSRGSSWVLDPNNVRAAIRTGVRTNYRNDNQGFRVAKML